MEEGGKKTLILIDTGMPGSEKKIFDYIKSIGFDPKDISLIILTHPDIDHSGALFAIKESLAPDAQVAIPEAGRGEEIERSQGQRYGTHAWSYGNICSISSRKTRHLAQR